MRPVALLLLPLVFAPQSIRADDVRLKNGKTFEGVIVEEVGSTVRVQIPGGSLSLPSSSVREIVRSESPYAQFLERSALLRSKGARASDWLELARWSRAHELETAAREAALEAAEIDPQLAGLAPIMRSFGYELDESGQLWLPMADAMKSRGMVMAGGRWMTPDEADDYRREVADEARDRREARDAQRLEQAAAEVRLAAAEMDLARAQGSYYGGGYGGGGYYADGYYPVAWYPGYWVPGLGIPGQGLGDRFPGHHPGHHGGFRGDFGPTTPHFANGTMTLDMTVRQPGSLFPGTLSPMSSAARSHPR
jgi:hypothetical protein